MKRKSTKTMQRWWLPGFGPLSLASWSVVAGLTVYTAWISPLTPWANHRGDAALGQGNVLAAIAAYDEVIAANPDPMLKAKALERTATLWSVALSDRDEAIRRWQRRLKLPATAAQRGEAWERVARLHQANGDYGESAKAFAVAWRSHQASKKADERLLASARAEIRAGKLNRANATFKRLAKHYPEHAALAALERAQLKLSRGNEEVALGLFEEAGDSRGLISEVAHLGSSVCLERLGSLDEALAELDEVELLPEDLLDARAERMRARAH